MKSRLKNFLVNLGLLLAGILAGYVILEGGLRLCFFHSLSWPDTAHLRLGPHPECGWCLLPNQTAIVEKMDYRVEVKINSRGLRDGEHDYDPKPGVFRIVVLGDSFMEASQVEGAYAFTSVLAEYLVDRNVEVINLGVEGYGTVQEYLFLKEEGLKYEPDLVLLGLYSENDLHDNSLALSRVLWGEDNLRVFARPFAHLNAAGNGLVIDPPDRERIERLWQSVLAQRTSFTTKLLAFKKSLTSKTYKRIRRSLKQNVLGKKYNPNVFIGAHLDTFAPRFNSKVDVSAQDYEHMWVEAWEITCQAILETNVLAKTNGAKLAVFTVPSKIQVDPEYLELVQDYYPGLALDIRHTERKLLAFGASNSVPVLDLVPVFRETQQAMKARLHYTLDDAHWNPAGHELAARTVAEWLDAQQLIPPAREEGIHQ